MNEQKLRIALDALKSIARGKERDFPSGHKAFLLTRVEAQQRAREALVTVGEDWGRSRGNE